MLAIDQPPSAGSLQLTLYIPGELPYFQGHFPDYPLLPGVIQLEWALDFAAEYLHIEHGHISRIDQLKFSQPVLPETQLQLLLQHYPGRLYFEYRNGATLYANGKLTLCT